MGFAVRLDDWLRREGKTQEWLAGRVGVDQTTISRLCWRAGKRQVRKPSWELAAKIKAETGGAVTEADWSDESDRAA